MRILQAYKVYPPDVHGGISEVMTQISGLRAYADEVRVLVARDRGFSKRYVHENTPVEAVASLGQIMSMPIAPAFPFALKRAARDCDVLALHTPFPLNDLGLLLGVPNDVAVVLHWHAEITGSRAQLPFVESMLRNTLKRSDRIIVTDQTMIETSPLLSKIADKCEIVPYGLDVAFWSASGKDEETEILRIKAQHPRLVISIGRLVPYKGYPVLLEAMQHVDGELIIIGEGSDSAKLKQHAERLGIAKRVHFKGYLPREEIRQYLHSSRMFVLPSISKAEAFGLVQVEAMAAGLPVINTDLKTAVPLIARHEMEALTVEPGNARALANAINRLLDDPDLLARLGRNGHFRAQTTYSSGVFLASVRKVYGDAHRSRAAIVGRQ